MSRRPIRIGACVVVAALVLAAFAAAYFRSSGTGSAVASAGSVNAPGNVSALQSGSNVTISWTAATLSSGGAVQGYYVTRSDSTVVCGKPTLVTVLNCTDTSVPAGTYTYTVTAVFNSFAVSATSGSLTILTAPRLTSTPSNPSTSASASFSFSGGGGSGYQCQLDGGGFTSCSSPRVYSGLSDGSHTFKVHAVNGASTGPDATYTWTIDTTAPTDALSLASGASGAFLNAGGTRLYYKGNASGSFKLVDAVTDSGTGPVSATFPAIATTGWAHGAETVTTGSGSAPTISYTSSTFSWTASPSNPSAYTVTSTDVAGNTSSGASPAFVSDSTPPGGGAVSVNGTAASGLDPVSYSSSLAFTINTRTDYTETQSATASGLASSVMTVQSESVSNGSCGAPGSGGPFTTAVTISGTTQPSGILTGYCYLYTLSGTDNVGNSASISTTVIVDTSTPTTPALTFSGLSSNAFYSSGANALYFRPAAGGTYIVSASATAPSGIAGYAFSSLSANNFTGTQTGNQVAYTFGATATQPGSAPTVSATSNSGKTSANASYNLVSDTTAPTGGAVSVNGTAASSGGSSSTTSITSFVINSRTDYSETQSASQSGLASSVLTVESEALPGSTCGAPGSGGPFTVPTTVSGTTQPSGILAGFCYLYTLTGTDNVGNAAAISTTVMIPSVTFSTAGTHTLTVPAHVTTFTFTLNGAGGGGGAAAGGAGGSVSGTITIPDSSSTTTLTVVIGGGGGAGTTTTAGTGGSGCSPGAGGGAHHGGTGIFGAAGGGSTCIYLTVGSPIAVAGSGGGAGDAAGGAGSGGNSGSAGTNGADANGGGGGITSPFAYGVGGTSSSGTAGSSGSASGGGAGGASAASGKSNGGGGGGGGDASGGGGGGGAKNATGSSGGGGGGSGYSGGAGSISVSSVTTGTGGAGGAAGAAGSPGSATFQGNGLSGS